MPPEEIDPVIVHHGISIPIDRSILSWNLIVSLVRRNYEHQEALQLGSIIAPGERILEIGAGLGFMSALAAKNPFTSALRAFEANPKLIPYIRKLHELNEVSTVELKCGVLGHGPVGKTLPFYLRKDFWESSLNQAAGDFQEVVEVECHDFNEELARFKPTLIICDIEGGELDLFEKADLSGVMKVYIEVHQKVLGRKGMHKLFGHFAERGFHYDQPYSRGSVILFSHVDRKSGPYPGFSESGQALVADAT